MELLQLRYFKDAAESENFSEVARKNLVPQPYISKVIKNLESELNCTLFDRYGKKIKLNDNGKYFYKKISSSLNSLDEAIDYFTNNTRNNILIYIQAGNRFISMLTADFLTSSSDIFISSINRISDLSSSNYDFTFMQPLDDMSNYNYTELMKDEIVLVVSKTNPLSVYDNISLSLLKNEAFIGYYKTMNLRHFTDKYCRENGDFEPNVVFETHDAAALRYMVEKNKGIALMPKKFFMLQPSNHLKLVSIKEKTYRTLLIAWKKDKILSPQAIQFKDFAINWFKSI